MVAVAILEIRLVLGQTFCTAMIGDTSTQPTTVSSFKPVKHTRIVPVTAVQETVGFASAQGNLSALHAIGAHLPTLAFPKRPTSPVTECMSTRAVARANPHKAKPPPFVFIVL